MKFRLGTDLERNDFVDGQPEDELKLKGTAREISGEPIRDNGRAVFLRGRQRLDRVLVFLLGLGFPFLDRGQNFDRLAFVTPDGTFGKAFGQSLRITPVFGGDIESDGCWKIDRHGDQSRGCMKIAAEAKAKIMGKIARQ